MKVFRLTRRKYASILSGKGAAQSVNRWNSKGTEIIYTAESRALAMAEVAVHLSMTNLPADFVMVEIEVPDQPVAVLEDQLEPDWSAFPPTFKTQQLGDDFISVNKFLLLKVPSAVVRGDYNFLINPFHPEFNEIKIVATSEFLFDRRLFRE